MSRVSNQHVNTHFAVRSVLVVSLLATLLWAISAKPKEPAFFDLEGVFQAEAPDPSFVTQQGDPHSISMAVFDVELWHMPEVIQPEVQRPVVQIARPNLQLMAILMSASNEQQPDRYAVIYDQDNDQVHDVRIGAQIGPYSVRRISESEVELQDGSRVAVLELDLLEPRPGVVRGSHSNHACSRSFPVHRAASVSSVRSSSSRLRPFSRSL